MASGAEVELADQLLAGGEAAASRALERERLEHALPLGAGVLDRGVVGGARGVLVAGDAIALGAEDELVGAEVVGLDVGGAGRRADRSPDDPQQRAALRGRRVRRPDGRDEAAVEPVIQRGRGVVDRGRVVPRELVGPARGALEVAVEDVELDLEQRVDGEVQRVLGAAQARHVGALAP